MKILYLILLFLFCSAGIYATLCAFISLFMRISFFTVSGCDIMIVLGGVISLVLAGAVTYEESERIEA
jgi:hypothetical protein